MTAVDDFKTFSSTVFDRVVAMQKLAVAGSKSAEYASFNYPYGKLYWTNRLESILSPEMMGVDEFSFTLPIAMRLHTGVLGQGYPGELEIALQSEHAPAVMAYFWGHRDLVYQAGMDRIRFFQDDAFDFSCISGLSIFEEEDSTNTKKMLGVEFRLITKARIQIRRSF